MTVFALGVPCLINVLELNMNGGLQRMSSLHVVLNTKHSYTSFWSVRLVCTLDSPFILRKLTNYSRIILHSLRYVPIILFFIPRIISSSVLYCSVPYLQAISSSRDCKKGWLE